MAYLLNRCVFKAAFANSFLHNYFNDVLLIPAALPVMLWIQRGLKLRAHNHLPTWSEMLFHLAVWAMICEFIGPALFHHGRSDLWDVAAYTIGGVAACLWWNRHRALPE
jgi:hypothetical protein